MILFLLVASGAAMSQSGKIYPQIVVIPVAAAAADFAINYYKKTPEFVPLSAIISGLIIAAIMPSVDIAVQLLLALLAVVQKHLIKWRGSHVFNPTAFSVLIVSLLFGAPPTWWIAASAVVLIFLIT